MNPATITPPPTQLPVAIGSPAAVTVPVGPQPYRWTIAEYRELNKTGLFYDKKTMLLDGVLYVMVMPNPPHDLSLGLADDWLRAVFSTGYHVRNQMGFDIGTSNDPGPDLAVVAGSRRDLAGSTPTTAVMIVEVADSSLPIDLTKKAELYATAGVQEYWVIDVNGRQMYVFRGPVPLPANLGATAYRTHITLSPTDSVAPLEAPQATIRVSDLLP